MTTDVQAWEEAFLALSEVKVPSRVQQLSAKFIDSSRSAQEPRQLFLPGMAEFMRAMPNHLARSSLFAPVARGRKLIHKDTVLVSRLDAVIRFCGEQLDETQADVWMQAIYEASRRPLGEPVIIKRAEFLRAIGRHTGNYEYKWLNRTMQALTFAMLVIEVRTKSGDPKLSVGRNGALHLIEGFEFDNEAEVYTMRIDPRWEAIFGNREFALIDWKKRLGFGARHDMAKALQRLVATSDDCVQRHGVEWLKAKLVSDGRMRDFVVALERAMRELERLEIIAGGRIATSTKGQVQAVWARL